MPELTVDLSPLDPKDWMEVQALIAEVGQTALSKQYLAVIKQWDSVVRGFRRLERRQLFERTPSEEDLAFHEAALHELIGIGQILLLMVNKIPAEFEGVNLLAYVQELQDTLMMWHGRELEPTRKAEIEKAIFGDGAT